MQIKILKDFQWLHKGRILSYSQGSIEEVHSTDGEAMIKHGYAECVKLGHKMVNHDLLEDKMIHTEIDNKAVESKPKKSKK